jgi:hypothetical protein
VVKYSAYISAAISIAIAVGVARLALAQSDDDQNPYADDAQQIAQVRQQHLAELMKIPHVKGVATELDDRGEVLIAVEVDSANHLDEVSSAVPSKIEGFPVDIEVAQSMKPPRHHRVASTPY